MKKNPKSGPKKKTDGASASAVAADKTSESASLKPTPKSASDGKTAKKSTPTTAAPVTKAVVAATSVKKPASAVKAPLKKAAVKTKPPTGGKAPVASKPAEVKAEEPEPAPVVESKEEVATEVPKAEEAKDELEAASEMKDELVEEAEVAEEVEFVEEEVVEEDPEELAEEGEGEEAEAAEVEEVQNEITDMAKARKIKKEQEIFVGGLDRDAVEQDLKNVFEKVGEVVEVRLLKDFTTNKNKGFAFVKFANKEQAAKAISEMKSPMIRGKRCGVAPSEDNDTLFVGNICNSWTKEAIKRKMKEYGIDNVEGITLVADTRNEGLSRGFAFVEFSCHADAMLAYKRLQKPDAIFGHPERTAKVAFAEPLREPDPEVLAQIKSVFVDGLPPYWDEDRVKEQFKGYGEIERVVLARNMPTAKRRDFGFVDFTTHDAAVACIGGVNNTELGDGNSKSKARARLANPLPKTQAVKGGMSGGFRIGHSGVGYSRFGRGFARGGRHFPSRAGFQRGTAFSLRGRGRGGRFSHPEENMERPYSGSRGRRPFGFRGGRGGRAFSSARSGAFARGRGNVFQPRRQSFAREEDFGVPFNARYVDEDPYLYAEEGGHGVKRPYSLMEQDSGYMEPMSRLRARYDHPDSVHGRYQGSLGTTDLYSHDYYGSDYGGSSYSSPYGGEPSARGYYY